MNTEAELQVTSRFGQLDGDFTKAEIARERPKQHYDLIVNKVEHTSVASLFTNNYSVSDWNSALWESQIPLFQVSRKATMGSTFVARRAGR